MLGKLISPLQASGSSSETWENNSIYFMGLLWKINELLFIKCTWHTSCSVSFTVVMCGQNERWRAALLSRVSSRPPKYNIRWGREVEWRRVPRRCRGFPGPLGQPIQATLPWKLTCRCFITRGLFLLLSFRAQETHLGFLHCHNKHWWSQPGPKSSWACRNSGGMVCSLALLLWLKLRKGAKRQGSKKMDFHSAKMRLNFGAFPQNSDKKRHHPRNIFSYWEWSGEVRQSWVKYKETFLGYQLHSIMHLDTWASCLALA